MPINSTDTLAKRLVLCWESQTQSRVAGERKIIQVSFQRQYRPLKNIIFKSDSIYLPSTSRTLLDIAPIPSQNLNLASTMNSSSPTGHNGNQPRVSQSKLIGCR
jgi:hypothetical protein